MEQSILPFNKNMNLLGYSERLKYIIEFKLN